MVDLGRYWNGQWHGLPGFFVTCVAVGWRQLADRVATLLWRGNLEVLGNGAHIQSGVRIRRPGNVAVGRGTSIASGCWIASEKTDSRCIIGDDVIINREVHLDFSGGLTIASGVVISENAAIFTHSHGRTPKGPAHKTPLRIEKGAWIGYGAIVADGVSRIGVSAIVAAGAVVTNEVPDRVVVGGVPARPIGMNPAEYPDLKCDV